jgi:hypothetical protein
MMSSDDIRAWGEGFKAGSNAVTRSILGDALAEAQALTAELAAIKIEVARLEASFAVVEASGPAGVRVLH